MFSLRAAHGIITRRAFNCSGLSSVVVLRSSSPSCNCTTSARSRYQSAFFSTTTSSRSAASTTLPAHPLPVARRALLYVPGSNVKMLKSALKGTKSSPDAIILDLEDSVATGQKGAARRNVFDALQSADSTRSQLFVRINSPTRSFGLDDLEVIMKADRLQGIVIPKVDTVKDVQVVADFMDQHGLESNKDQLKIIASVESPLSLINLKEIATCSKRIDSLLFAAEDYCASSNLIRTGSRKEMLFVRSNIVAVAKAFGLNAIDLVRVAYKGDKADDELRDEAIEGRQLGFDGKQCIHPNQVDIVQDCFTPNEREIERAHNILGQYESVSSGGAGAYGLVGEDGSSDMIDAPMLLQAERILAQARAAGVLP